MKKSFALFIAVSILLFTSILIIQNYKIAAIGIDNLTREYLQNEAQLIFKSAQKIIKKELNSYVLNYRCIDSIEIDFDNFTVTSSIYYLQGVQNCSNNSEFAPSNSKTSVMIDYTISSKYGVRKLSTITKREYIIISLP